MSDLKFFFAVVSATGGSAFVHGFHTALLNILAPTIQAWYMGIQISRKAVMTGFYDISVMHAFILSSFALGAIVGGALICLMLLVMGRRQALLANNSFVVIALVVLSFAKLTKSFEILIVGRFIMGLSAGFSSGICPMYLIEISPECVRGAIGSFYYVMVAASMLLAYVLTSPDILGTLNSWWVMFIFGFVPALIQGISLIFCPESPKYLLFNREDEDASEEAMSWLRGADAEQEMEELQEESAVLKDIGPVTLDRLFTDQTIRSPFIICTVIMCGQQICGIEVMLYFSTAVLMQLGYSFEDSVNLTIGLGMCNLLAAIVSMFLVDRIGRMPLLMGSFGGMMFCTVCITLIIVLMEVGDDISQEVIHVVVVFFFVYIVAFAIGAGTIPWFLTSELSNHFARPMVVSIATSLNWVIHFTAAMSFMSINYWIGNYVFIIYFFFDLVILIFIILTMRETKRMPAADIVELFYD